MSNEELKEAKNLLKMLKSDEWYKEDYTEQALNIIYAYQEDGEFITEDELDELTRHEAEAGAIRVMFFLAHCEPSAPFGYRLNGYANAENATKDDITLKLEDIIEANDKPNVKRFMIS